MGAEADLGVGVLAVSVEEGGPLLGARGRCCASWVCRDGVRGIDPPVSTLLGTFRFAGSYLATWILATSLVSQSPDPPAGLRPDLLPPRVGHPGLHPGHPGLGLRPASAGPALHGPEPALLPEGRCGGDGLRRSEAEGLGEAPRLRPPRSSPRPSRRPGRRPPPRRRCTSTSWRPGSRPWTSSASSGPGGTASSGIDVSDPQYAAPNTTVWYKGRGADEVYNRTGQLVRSDYKITPDRRAHHTPGPCSPGPSDPSPGSEGLFRLLPGPASSSPGVVRGFFVSRASPPPLVPGITLENHRVPRPLPGFPGDTPLLLTRSPPGPPRAAAHRPPGSRTCSGRR